MYELSVADDGHLPADLLHPVHGGGTGPPVRVEQLLVILVVAGHINGPCGVQVLDVVQLLDGACGQQVADSGAGAHAHHRADSGGPCFLVQIEHPQGRLPVVADVQVVRTGRDRGTQHGQAEAVVRADGVEHDVGVGQCGPEGGVIGHVHLQGPHGRTTGTGEVAYQPLGRFRAFVGHHNLGHLGQPGSHPHRHRPHRSGSA